MLCFACTKTETDDSHAGNPDGNAGAKMVRVYVSDEGTEVASAPESRAYFAEGYRIAWESGDRVATPEGDEYALQQDDDGKWFVELPNAAKYTLYYPASSRSGLLNGQPEFRLPASQTHVAGSFDKGALCARAEAGPGEKLTFRYLCSVVKLTLQGTGVEAVARIELSTAGLGDERIASGAAIGRDASGNACLVPFSGDRLEQSANTVVLNVSGVTLTADGTDFHVPIFPTRFSRGFYVKIVLSDGRTMIGKAGVGQTAQRGRILAMPVLPFKDNTTAPVSYSSDGQHWELWEYDADGNPLVLSYPASRMFYFRDNDYAQTKGLTRAHLQTLATAFRSSSVTDKTIALDFSGATYESTVFPSDIFGYSYPTYGLTSISLPRNIVSIANGKEKAGAFYGAKNLAEVNYPEGFREIGDYAFTSSGLQTVVVPAGVTRVGVYALSSAEVKSIRIEGETEVLAMGNCAFSCVEAAELRCYRTTPPVVEPNTSVRDAFYGLGSNVSSTTGTTIYVPAASMDAYLAAPAWGWMTSFQKPNGDLRFPFVGM